MIVINKNKAIEITKEKIRVWREEEFKKNDIAIQNAILDKVDTTSLIERRDYLRDLPNQCEGKNIDELKILMIDLGL